MIDLNKLKKMLFGVVGNTEVCTDNKYNRIEDKIEKQ